MEQTCSKCGFPLKKGDEFCDFCNTPLVETKPHKITTVMKAGGGGGLISPKRLAIYAVVVLLILILDLLLK